MHVNVLLFAHLRDKAGRHEIELELPAAATLRTAADTLQQQLAGLDLKGVMGAVNQRYADPGTVLNEGDTVAFLPPVSGG